jgi:hypothetical protein
MSTLTVSERVGSLLFRPTLSMSRSSDLGKLKVVALFNLNITF